MLLKISSYFPILILGSEELAQLEPVLVALAGLLAEDGLHPVLEEGLASDLEALFALQARTAGK